MSDVNTTEDTPTPKKRAPAKKKVAAKKKGGSKKKASKRGGKPGVAPGGGKKAIAARALHHGVIANGKEYGSVFKAFEALKLPLGSHQTFRKKLKADGKATFETETGKKVNFKLN